MLDDILDLTGDEASPASGAAPTCATAP